MYRDIKTLPISKNRKQVYIKINFSFFQKSEWTLYFIEATKAAAAAAFYSPSKSDIRQTTTTTTTTLNVVTI